MILYAEDFGHGEETVIFLHSGLQTGRTDFEHLLPYFNDRYRILLPDLRGHGKSGCDNLENYFESAADDLADTIRHSGITDIHLVGVSLGALAAVHFALKYRASVKSLILSGLMFKKPYSYSELHKNQIEMQNKVLENKETITHFDSIHPPDWRRLLDITRNPSWYPFDKNAEVLEEKLPIHVIAGSESAHELETIDAHVRAKASIAVIDNGGHLLNHDSPGAFSRSILDYIHR
ncbi:alpha/beta fold hydrolase [Salinicoccus carnicancri]|uniref:alpha/beta fold hydrolase n=1 Tax=Salinicoccus carnicancri TaxID=558170 RepID=UPI000306EEFB|nr:alpha/beta hydrolase [Salinicoccus carnicancri]